MQDLNTLPELIEAKQIAKLCGVSPVTYRRRFLRLPNHPKPVWTNVRPMRFRTREILGWLGIDPT